MHMRIRSMLMAAILVIQNDDTMAMLLYEASLVGVQLFSYVPFVLINLHGCWTRLYTRSITMRHNRLYCVTNFTSSEDLEFCS